MNARLHPSPPHPPLSPGGREDQGEGGAGRGEGEALASAIRRQLAPEVRVGVDLVEVAQLRARFEGRDGLLREVFMAGEIEYAMGQRRPWPHFAARLAAKEATFKAIGCGVTGGVAWHDVEVRRDEAGEPRLAVSGETARRAARVGVNRFAVSLSHGPRYAVAVVLATST